jgi:hypothetical protein
MKKISVDKMRPRKDVNELQVKTDWIDVNQRIQNLQTLIDKYPDDLMLQGRMQLAQHEHQISIHEMSVYTDYSIEEMEEMAKIGKPELGMVERVDKDAVIVKSVDGKSEYKVKPFVEKDVEP